MNWHFDEMDTWELVLVLGFVTFMLVLIMAIGNDFGGFILP
jgi:hypothetical protein